MARTSSRRAANASSSASRSSRLPYRICEANSCFGGGKPGVSDTLAAALWGLDFMFTLAQFGASGVNMQTGVNHLDFISYYSAIRNDANGAASIGPEYYGMLAFAQAGKGERIALDYDADGINLKAYAVLGDHGDLMVTLINKDQNADADVTMTTGQTFQRATAWRLKGLALGSADNVTLGGIEVAAKDRWHARQIELLLTAGGVGEIHVPAASAAVVTWSA